MEEDDPGSSHGTGEGMSEVKIIAVNRIWWKHFIDALYCRESNRN
jgi:hypothetical protein